MAPDKIKSGDQGFESTAGHFSFLAPSGLKAAPRRPLRGPRITIGAWRQEACGGSAGPKRMPL
ncbi:hypothetical protein E2C01_033960 [Portunus trituberculatus]|uniref:Uncharacterized protein n=1 Tax=Portunus trituberculatus TaxID=210409 RepID=A0A5B7F779_PORTR|nr:hypothetical protein [Portunus trituberculatus]